MGTSEYLPATPLLGYNLPWGGMGMSQELLMRNCSWSCPLSGFGLSVGCC